MLMQCILSSVAAVIDSLLPNTELDIKGHSLQYAENECPIFPKVVRQDSQAQNPANCSVAGTNKVIDTENEYTGPNDCPFDHSHMEIKDESQTSNIFHDGKFPTNIGSAQLYENPGATSDDISMTSTHVRSDEEIHVASKLGTEFESEDNANKCYSQYAILNAFSIRKDFVNKSRIDGAVIIPTEMVHT
ncbi:hypothetical protein VNO78_33556 [Psophocarpus tetragonolobus]|uniref:Uncharacterized protein n=1 Tax=Psophocarpus tetragonolobus TaxID=3891 RepID=A0AAN9RQT4_PSOTE